MSPRAPAANVAATILVRKLQEDALAQRQTLNTILAAGLTAGVLDILAAFVINLEIGPVRVLQAVASGVLGVASYDGGPATAALGLALHLLIALAAAGVYVLAASRLPLINARAVQCGILFGLLMFAVMQYVIVPVSAAAIGPPTMAGTIKQMLAHAFLFGLPIGLITRRMLKG